MKYHITIKDNETGQIIVDADTCAFIGALAKEDTTTQSLCCANCKDITLAATAAGALQSARRAIEDLPAGIKKLTEKLGKKFN